MAMMDQQLRRRDEDRHDRQQDDHDSAPEIVPHHNDILLGRGGKNNQHVGNEQLRNLARAQRDTYRHSSKKGKSYISRQIVSYVRGMDPPARFLKKDSVTGRWVDVGDDIAREKAAQALRDAVSALHAGDKSGGGGGGGGGGSPKALDAMMDADAEDVDPLPYSPFDSSSGPGTADVEALPPLSVPMPSPPPSQQDDYYWQEHRRSSSAPAAVMGRASSHRHSSSSSHRSSAFRSPTGEGGEQGGPGAKRSRSYEHAPSYLRLSGGGGGGGGGVAPPAPPSCHSSSSSSSNQYRTPQYDDDGVVGGARPRLSHRDHPNHDIAANANAGMMDMDYDETFSPPRPTATAEGGGASYHYSCSSSDGPELQPLPHRSGGGSSAGAGKIIQPSPVRVSPEGAQVHQAPSPMQTMSANVVDSTPPGGGGGGDVYISSPGKIQLTPICSNQKGTAAALHHQNQRSQEQHYGQESYRTPGEEQRYDYYQSPAAGGGGGDGGGFQSPQQADFVPSNVPSSGGGDGDGRHRRQEEYQYQQQRPPHHHPQARQPYRPEYIPSRGHPHHQHPQGGGGYHNRGVHQRHGYQGPPPPPSSLMGDFHANSSMNEEDFDLFDGDLLRDTAIAAAQAAAALSSSEEGGGGRGGGSSSGHRSLPYVRDDDEKSARSSHTY